MPDTSRLNPFAVRGGAVTVSAAFAREAAERVHTTAKAARLCSMRDTAACARPIQVINDSGRFTIAARAQTDSRGKKVRERPPTTALRARSEPPAWMESWFDERKRRDVYRMYGVQTCHHDSPRSRGSPSPFARAEGRNLLLRAHPSGASRRRRQVLRRAATAHHWALHLGRYQARR